MQMHATGLDVRQAGFDFLPNVDAIHEVVPSGGGRKAPDELDGFGLDARALRKG